MKQIIKMHIKKSTGPDSALGSCVIDVLLHPNETLYKINMHKLPCSKKEFILVPGSSLNRPILICEFWYYLPNLPSLLSSTLTQCALIYLF